MLNSDKYQKVKALLLENGAFDADYYLANGGHKASSREEALEYYLRVGVKEDHKPNADFDPLWYKNYYGDVEGNGFLHFLKFGKAENRFANQEEMLRYQEIIESGRFDVKAYLNRYDDLKKVDENFDPILHYVRHGRKEGRQYISESEIRELEKLKEDERIVSESGLFDSQFYVKSYPDVLKKGHDSLNHFCLHGWKEGRNPNDQFNVNFYLETYPDVKELGENPFVHWLLHGHKEDRLINASQMKTNEPDLVLFFGETRGDSVPLVLLQLLHWMKVNTEINFCFVFEGFNNSIPKCELLSPVFVMDEVERESLEAKLIAFCGGEVQALYLDKSIDDKNNVKPDLFFTSLDNVVREEGESSFYYEKGSRFESDFNVFFEFFEYYRLLNSDEFDEQAYIKRYNDLKNVSKDFDAVLHYVKFGRHENRIYHSDAKATIERNGLQSELPSVDEDVIDKSGLFNKGFYLSSYPDVAALNQSPIQHYCQDGWREKRNPNEEFSTNFYLNKYLDVKKSGANPFVHWLKHGRGEGRLINKIEVNPFQTQLANCPSVIFVSHEASQTGAPAVLLSLMQWVKENTDINFSIVVGSQGVWNSRFENLAPTFYLDGYHHNELQTELKEFCGSHVQAVYINTIASALYAEKLSFLQAEFITHVHEMESVFKVYDEHVDVLKRICKKFISVSPGSTQAIEKRFNLKEIELYYLKPFIDKRKLSEEKIEKPTDKKVIFGCGAVEKRKGFDLFCKVARELKKTRSDFHMYWIGSDVGKDMDAMESIEYYQVEDVVDFLGSKSYPRDYFRWGDIFLLPSREDPYPLVCMEAAECKMPVVCFDTQAGGMHTFVEEDAGSVVAYLDTKSMARAVAELLDDDVKRQAMGERAYEKVKDRHYVDVVAPQIIQAMPANLDITEHSEIESYKALIRHAKAVSFDIFDTLVTRRVADPNVVFDIIEHKITQSEAAPIPLIQQRMSTAGRVLGSYKGKVDDISIDEIYYHMAFYNDPIFEKSTEIEMCIAHPIGKILYDYALKLEKPIYITSDMYLDEPTVTHILNKNGYETWEAFYLSSTVGRKKDTGKLYSLVKDKAAEKGILPAEILHIGDSWVGDVKHARQQGLSAVRFAPLYDRNHKLFTISPETTLSQSGRIWDSFSTQATRMWRETYPEQAGDFYTRLGFELSGPLASMMAMHTKELADQHGAHHVVFMARDGRIIQKAFNALYKDDLLNHRYQSSYLHLSRATVIPATFEHPLTSNDIYFLVEGLHLQEKPLRYFIEKAGLNPTSSTVLELVSHYFDSIESVPTWHDANKLAKMFMSLSHDIYEANAEHREALKVYLTQHGLMENKKTILVDVGWLLNIQSRLVNFLKRHGSKGELIGAYVGSRDRINKQIIHSSLLFDNGDPSMWSSFLEKNVTLFEVLFSAPEPSASGLVLDQLGNSEVAFKPMTMPLSSEFQVAQKLQLGAERYFEYLAEARKVFFPDMVSKDYFFEIFRSLVTTESDLAKATLGNFEVRLGGQHEFITHQNLVENNKPFEYVLKKSDEFFDPIYFDNISKDNPPKVVIITSSGLQNGSTRYRSIHLADSLQYQGTSSVLIHALTPLDIAEPLIAEAATVIFQRCFEGQGNVGKYLTIAKQCGKRCIAEMDDLVFPEHVLNIGSVKGGEWSEKEAMFVAESYEKLIQQMDKCIVSTPLLKAYIGEQYSLNACVVRNKVTSRRLVPPQPKKRQSELKLIYASGTYSHKQDFAFIEEPLFSFLTSHPSVKLSILGAAQVSERLLSLPNVSNYPVLSYTAMLEFISRHNLMLVPLEDDVFNQAKSSVKFVECGAVGVPVLASNIGEFAYAIEHGSNGLLASSQTEWEDTLIAIAQRPEYLDALAKGAFETVSKLYNTEVLEKEAQRLILEN